MEKMEVLRLKEWIFEEWNERTDYDHVHLWREILLFL